MGKDFNIVIKNILEYSKLNDNKITIEELERFITDDCDFDNILLLLKRQGIIIIDVDEKLECSEQLDDALNSYIKEIKKYSLLSEEEEKELMYKISLGDESARGRMIESNLRLVLSTVNGFASKSEHLLDLLQEGNIGLIKAVDRYDLNKGVRFSTYATWWIRQAIIKYISDKSRVIRIPTNSSYIVSKMKKYEADYYNKNMEKPTLTQIASALNISVKRVTLLKKMNNFLYSLEFDCSKTEDGCILEYFVPTYEEGYETVEKAYDNNLLNNLAKSILDERTYFVFKLRYGFDGKAYTYQEIGDMLGVTRERVRSILNQASSKLNSNCLFRKMYLTNYLSAISDFMTKPYLHTEEFDSILKSILDDFEYRIACLLFGISTGFAMSDEEISAELSVSEPCIVNTKMNIIFKLVNNTKVKNLNFKYCINNKKKIK